MLTSKFAQTRNSMHTFSRAPLAKGQKWLDQATAPAGHNVSFDRVRAETIPVIASIADRDEHFLELKNGKRIVGGDRGKNFSSVISFIDRLKIKEIPYTNGESYVIIDDDNNYITDFIDPSDKPISQFALSEGYELLMFSECGEKISRNVGWSFDPFNCIIHFSGKNPKSPDWEFGEVSVEGFIYIGKKMSSIMGGIDEAMTSVKEEMNTIVDAAIAVQPFKFSTTEMTTVGDPYPLEDSHWPDVDYFQCLSIVIPGFVFEITSLDRDETVMTEMRHLPTGDTQIFLNLPWSIQYECPIMRYDYDSGQPGIGNRIPVVGKYKFTAMAFVTNAGEKIPVKKTIDYIAHPEEVVPTPQGYELSTPFEDGTPVSILSMPPHPQYSGAAGGFGYYSDDDTIVNVYGARSSHD